MKAMIVYATITGNNQTVADILNDQLTSRGVDVDEIEISQADPTDYRNYDLCLMCVYTYDEGALPEEGLDFYEDLAGVNLSGKLFCVMGSGDTFYEEFYNVAVDKFTKVFEQTGAKQGAQNLKIELEPDEQDVMKIDQIADELVKAIKAKE
ncbi:flavodoxin [Pediococcus claussenii]|uniref:Flavodoxin n=1 Tax=Pediococcus claussenii (strain ATCC BAA-344 / DSM 14800 / JCM 18046 / KCTC 3811 / LMG 21948 / P06) TaxID=701521 RepID=G8PEM2_PEDCP|nr:flavodoxin [Pediococcus claussenii]AEV95631.1 flavodoxin [Pediococcus claussenii ATCC BAA-344]ANZ69151.1 flavodoxin [Pediococcus claussenii]ANZ70968.1 flavodoxin [Pediococcus claussenii]KRN20136.1 hypothetical protein IV79_GL000801 [Pediococcus claussenii]